MDVDLHLKVKIRAILTGCCLSRSAGGPFESVSGLATTLSENPSMIVDVVGTYGNAAQWSVDQQKWAKTNLTAMPANGLWSAPGLCKAIGSAIAKGNRTVVHGQGLWDASSVAMAMLSNRTETPMVVSPRGMLEPWALAQRRTKKTIAWQLWQKRVLETAGLIHATSVQEAESVRTIGLHNPIAVIPNGVRIPENRENAVLQKPEALNRCIFLSRIHEKKGLPLLLRAWAALRPKGWVLEIAGYGETAYVETIRQMIRQLGCDSIHFVGEKSGNAKAEFLRTANLFVLPSYSENFGVAVAEAMANGVPAIATHGTPWKVLADKSLGWWVPPTTDAIYEALRSATRLAPEQLRCMGFAARAYAADEFSWIRVARTMSACYEWLCSDGPLPQSVVLGAVRTVP
jgi:glycosyltransferase involved in cell wall biosynthesis